MGDKKQKKGKTLHNSTNSAATTNVPDLIKFGDGDTFKLICKASSESEGWMKSTKAMEIPGVGCVVQVTTQQGKHVSEALTFVPNVRIDLIGGDKKNGRRLVQLNAQLAVGDLPEQAIYRRDPVHDTLPAEGVAEIVAGINERHAVKETARIQAAGHKGAIGCEGLEGVAGPDGIGLTATQRILGNNEQQFRGVLNARRRTAYHDLMRFDGSEASADAIINWVNGATDLCSVVYDTMPVQRDSISLSWSGEHPVSHINVGDFVRVRDNGAVSLMSEAQALDAYDFMTHPAETECLDTDVPAVEQRCNKNGVKVNVYYYDGAPERAGFIVNRAQSCQLSCVCYGRDGLTVYSASQGVANFVVRAGHYVVTDGDIALAGSREWLDAAYPYPV